MQEKPARAGSWSSSMASSLPQDPVIASAAGLDPWYPQQPNLSPVGIFSTQTKLMATSALTSQPFIQISISCSLAKSHWHAFPCKTHTPLAAATTDTVCDTTLCGLCLLALTPSLPHGSGISMHMQINLLLQNLTPSFSMNFHQWKSELW